MTSISLCMIVRNEAPRLQRAIDSARPHVDQIVIVDTGSNDGTVDIARDNRATVAHIPFKDFSHARNYSISLSRCEYIFVLDADEVLQGELPEPKDNPKDKQAFTFHRANFGPDYRACDDAPLRLFPRWAVYEGRVHETVNGSVLRGGGSIRHTPVTIDHYLPSLADRRVKNLRYIEILKQEIADAPDIQRMEFLAAEYYQIGEFKQAAAVAGTTSACRQTTTASATAPG